MASGDKGSFKNTAKQGASQVGAQSKKQKNLKHIAIIPDGNRRWARARGLPAIEGHRQGIKTAQKILKAFHKFDVPYITLWGFSTENWKRPKHEVEALFTMFTHYLNQLADPKKLQEYQAHVRVIGRKDRINKSLKNAIDKAHAANASVKNPKFTLIIAIDYGGQDQIRRAILQMLHDIKRGKLALDQAIKTLESEQALEFIDSFMETHGVPYPDIIMRTSGEKRLSGLYVWQNAYAELFFVDKHFPDLTVQDIEDIINQFYHRDRRFGGDSKKK